MQRGYLIAVIAGIAALPLAALAALAQQAVPSIAPQVRDEMWAIPSSPVPMLAYLIRPVGGGPFPLVVMNHGVSLDVTGRSYFPVIEFRDAALWFARQGYVVVAPVRPGYGATAIEIPERGLFGVFFSGVGKCSDAEFREAGLAVASIDKWVIDYMVNAVIYQARRDDHCRPIGRRLGVDCARQSKSGIGAGDHRVCGRPRWPSQWQT